MMSDTMIPVEFDKIYRLFNIGATGLVAAEYDEDVDIMPASWICALDHSPCKVTVVIDSSHYTRELIEQSGLFAIGLPGAGIIKEMLALGRVSKADDPDKLEKSGVKLLPVPLSEIPMVDGCVAWVVFRVVPEVHNEKSYDLFIGEAIEAWADCRVFSNGHWHFDGAAKELRTLHHIADGQFFCPGETVTVK